MKYSVNGKQMCRAEVGYDSFKVKTIKPFVDAVKEQFPEIYKRYGWFGLLKFTQIMGDSIIEEVVSNRDGFCLPHNLGAIGIFGKPIEEVKNPYFKKYLKLARTGNFFYSMQWIKQCTATKDPLKEFTFYPSVKSSNKVYQSILDNKFGHFHKAKKRDIWKPFYEAYKLVKDYYNRRDIKI